jgi:hypothetical protein
MLIGCLSLREGQALDINRIPGDGGIASSRAPFDDATLIDSALLSDDEADCLRPLVYAELASGVGQSNPARSGEAQRVEFVKLHDAYILTASGVPLLGADRGARAAILVVRDPRDVAPSLANHNRSTIDEAITTMSDPKTALCARVDRQYQQFRQNLASWSGHAESWLEQRDIPLHVVRYEDMKRDAAGALRAVLGFAGSHVTQADAERASSLARFESLRAQEVATGFIEWRDRNGRRFFRQGEAGTWRHELTPVQVGRIESAHAPMMARLGYELSMGAAHEGARERP